VFLKETSPVVLTICAIEEFAGSVPLKRFMFVVGFVPFGSTPILV
jgi:hypothetical protein